MKNGESFISSNVTCNLILYHTVRNKTLRYFLDKLTDLYEKARGALRHSTDDSVYNVAVHKLRSLSTVEWDEQVKKI